MTTRLVRILFVEEDISDQVRVERFIRKFAPGCELDVVSSTSGAIARLRKNEYDIALIDYRFRDGTAFDLVAELADTPAIFLTTPEYEEIAVLMMNRGAYYCLTKDRTHNYLMLLPGAIKKVLARREAEAALNDSQDRCRDLLDSVPDLYFCVSEEGVILLLNKAGAAQLGYNVSELLGKPFIHLVHPGSVEKIKRQTILSLARPDCRQNQEFDMVRKDGSEIRVRAEFRGQAPSGRILPVIRILAQCLPAVSARAEATDISSVSELQPPDIQGVVAQAGADSAIRGAERVLVVDDAADQRSIAAHILSSLGYRVVTTENGRDALTLFETSESSGAPFDIVLLDMSACGESDAATTYARMKEKRPGQKCVILSAACSQEEMARMKSLGVGSFLAKPYTLRTLGETVRRELDCDFQSLEKSPRKFPIIGKNDS